MKKAIFVVLTMMVCLFPLMANSDIESSDKVDVYVSGMKLVPSGTGVVKLTFYDQVGNTATFGILPSNGEDITLKTGSKIHTMLDTFVVSVDGKVGDKNSSNMYPARKARHQVSHALDAITLDQLKALGTKNTDGSYNLNIRLLGWADDECKCLLVWYYNSPTNKNDDYLYLVTVDDSSKIYLNEDSSSILSGLGGQTTSNKVTDIPDKVEIHFSERISLEKVVSLKSAFSASGGAVHQTKIDLSTPNCNCPFLNDATSCFSGLEHLAKVDLPKVFGVDGNTNDLNLESMFNNCSLIENVDLSSIKIGEKTVIKNMFYSCEKLSTVIVNDDFNPASADQVWSNSETFGKITASKTSESFKEKLVSYNENLASVDVNKDLSIGYSLKFDGKQVPVYSAQITYPKYISYTESVNNVLDGTSIGEYKTTDGNQTYKFNIQVAASQMTKDIKIKYCLGTAAAGGSWGDGKLYYEQNFTFAKMAESYKTCKPELAELMDAMLVYGKYAQLFFNIDTTKLPTDATVDMTAAASATAKAVQYSYTGSGTYPNNDAFGLSFMGNSLVCYADMRVRHSFSFANGVSWNDYTVSATNGVTVTKGVSDKKDRMIIEIIGFAPSAFDKEYTVTITNKTNGLSFSITYSPLSYITGAMKNSSDQSLKELCAAAYLFHTEAKEVF